MNALQLTTVLAAALAPTARATSDGGGQWANYPNLDPAMETACSERDLVSVTVLLWQHRADLPAYVDATIEDGWTPLHRAAYYGHTEIANALLAAGADPNAQEDDGRTPLHRAPSSYTHIPEIANALLAAGADPNAQDEHGETPLHRAACQGVLDLPGTCGVANALLAAGADPNSQNEDGWTPLHYAANNENADVARALVAGGADPEILDNDGGTALQFAQRLDRTEVAQYLLNDAPAAFAAWVAREQGRFSARVRDAQNVMEVDQSSKNTLSPALKVFATHHGLRQTLEALLAEAQEKLQQATTTDAMRAYYTTAVAKLQAKLDQDWSTKRRRRRARAAAGLARDADTNAKAGGGK